MAIRFEIAGGKDWSLGVVYPRLLETTEIAKLAGWHRLSLPTSALSWLGETYLRAFYRHVQRSKLEALVIHRDETEEIVAAAVIVWEPSRLLQRLLLHTPMAMFLLFRVPWIIAGLLHRRRTITTAGLIGCAASATNLLHAPEVVHFYTAPNRRGCGFGKALLEQCEGLLSSIGESRYWLKTRDVTDNRALAFYLQNGLVRMGTIIARGAQFAVLAKNLNPIMTVQSDDSARYCGGATPGAATGAKPIVLLAHDAVP